ncbi:MAG TPA: NAD-binding protein [Polyangia bacterium]
MQGRGRARAQWLYLRAVAREFRYSLVTFATLLVLGTVLFRVTPLADVPRPDLASSLYGTLALFGLGQPYNFPAAWYLRLLYLLYPAIGIGVVVQAVVRFGFLAVSKQNNEKEWIRVLASTFRHHIILCGLGNVGIRVLQRLLSYHMEVVAIEKDPAGPHVATAKALGVPVLIADVKQDESLVQAGIARARAIVIATNDDLANLEVALDARRMNPEIQVVMRMFDQDIAAKIGEAFGFERTFSTASLAAPAVAALALEGKVLGSCDVGTRSYITAEVTVGAGSRLCGREVRSFHHEYNAWVVARRRGDDYEHHPDGAVIVGEGDVLVFEATLDDLHRLNDDARAARGRQAG